MAANTAAASDVANGEVTDDVTDGNIVADGIVQKKSPHSGKKQNGGYARQRAHGGDREGTDGSGGREGVIRTVVLGH